MHRVFALLDKDDTVIGTISIPKYLNRGPDHPRSAELHGRKVKINDKYDREKDAFVSNG